MRVCVLYLWVGGGFCGLIYGSFQCHRVAAAFSVGNEKLCEGDSPRRCALEIFVYVFLDIR